MVFGGKADNEVGDEAPTEIIKYEEDVEWKKIEMMNNAAYIPYVGMESLNIGPKLYILGNERHQN